VNADAGDPARVDCIARRAVVTGIVQGVGFRYSTRMRARELGLAGHVRNLDDGSVDVWIEGRSSAVEQMLAWLRRGPPGARVERLEASAVAPTGRDRFEVLRG
jgi:acylphosphatase